MHQDTAYTGTAKALHWLVVVLLVAQYTLAWSMPDIGRTTPPTTLIGLHFSFGVLLFLAVAARLIWRMSHPGPRPEDGIQRWHMISARMVHWLLYFLLLVLPIIGWINASWRNIPVSFFGLFTLPKLIVAHAAGWTWTGDAHSLLATYAVLGLVGFHVGAALYHFFILRDRVMQRMMPNLRATGLSL